MNRSEMMGRSRSEKCVARRGGREATDEQVTEAHDHLPYATLDRCTRVYRTHAGRVDPNEGGTACAAPMPTNGYELFGWFSRASTSETTLMTATASRRRGGSVPRPQSPTRRRREWRTRPVGNARSVGGRPFVSASMPRL